MSKWLDDLASHQAQLDFLGFMQKREKDVWIKSLRPFGLIRKAVGRPLAVSFPANTYSGGPELLTLEIIDGLLATTQICPQICANAWAKTHDLPGHRSVERYQLALSQLQKENVPIGPLTAALNALLPALDTQVNTVYLNKYMPALVLRPKLLLLAQKMAEEQKKQKTLLEGTLKNKPFSYYHDLVVPDPAGGADLHREGFAIRIGAANKDHEEYCSGTCAAGIIVEKGTKGIAGDKYVKFKGITLEQMFNALKNTGWNMKNLKKKEDLEKVG